MSLADAVWGGMTALTLPLHTRRAALRTLMDDSVSASPVPRKDPSGAIEAGLVTLRLLNRLRTPLWKNTCFFRSVLRTTMLRRAGRHAVLRLGAAKGSGGATVAHAWVELAGMPIPDEGLDYTPLRAAR